MICDIPVSRWQIRLKNRYLFLKSKISEIANIKFSEWDLNAEYQSFYQKNHTYRANVNYKEIETLF